MCRLVLLAVIIANYNYKIEGAKILAVYPTPSISHQVVFRPLTNELVKRGHEVVVITTDPEYPKGQTPENLTEIDVRDVSYRLWREKVVDSVVDGNRHKNFWNIMAFIDTMVELVEAQFHTEEVKNLILNQNNTFDLVITEAWTRVGLGFSHALKVPVIEYSSFGPFNSDQMVALGASDHPIFYPHAPHTRVHGLTFWERLQQHYNEIWFTRKVFEADNRLHQLNKKMFGLDTPPLSELKKNIHMLFLNVHPFWDNNRPVPPGVLYIPGMHQTPQKELPKELKSYLDSSVYSVIYISFGTNVNPSLLPPEKVQTLIKAFSALPYDVLWKWNDDVLPGQTKNIKISKWLPQSDLLRHPKIKVFITQGGLQSTDEAITAGVPLIGIPMLGDQWFNAEQYVHHKIGQQVNLPDLELESFKNTIRTVIEDKSYRENMVRLRSIMQDQSTSPLERAVWWTEHVIRHGGALHLRPPTASMPWTQYYEVDIILLLLAVSLSVIILSFLVINKIVRFILRLVLSDGKVKKC